MARTLVDLVKIYATNTGTGTLALGGAVSSFRGQEALIDGHTYAYSIRQGANYEVGAGVYNAGSGTLGRSVQFSSAGGAPIGLGPNAIINFPALAADISQTGPAGPAGPPGPQGPPGPDITGALLIVNNLSDLMSAATARTNLGLGGLAVLDDAPSDGSTYGRKDGAWAVAGGGGGGGDYKLLYTVTAAGGEAYLEQTGIDQTYSDLIIVVRSRVQQNGGGNTAIRFGPHTTSGTKYNTAYVAGGSNSGFNPTAAGANTFGQDQVPGPFVLGPDSASPPGVFVTQELTLYDYANPAGAKEYATHYRTPQGATSASDALQGTAFFLSGAYRDDAQPNVDAISVNGLSGVTFAAGSYLKIYGRK